MRCPDKTMRNPKLLRLSLAMLWAGFLLTSVAAVRADGFPQELTQFTPAPQNPIFTGAGPASWDVKIRERGGMLHEADGYHLWYTGYDGTREGIRRLGYATSTDGIHWKRFPQNPLCPDRWVEDMMVVKHEGTYYMFAEGVGDQAQLLVSSDPIHWRWVGYLHIRMTDGKPIAKGPYGTPTAWFENGQWFLFYERRDLGIWLATSKDLKVFTNLQDEPVLTPGPGRYDERYVALNQIIKYKDRYYACYHGSPGNRRPALWSSNLAASDDLIHWKKWPGNPLRPLSENRSSNLLMKDGDKFRLYTTHESVWLYFSQPARPH
jgi:sucrose-6-phosphate hydrolase SacC (GH32 family)